MERIPGFFFCASATQGLIDLAVSAIIPHFAAVAVDGALRPN